MPEQKRVTIVHPDGREYSIEPSKFTDGRISPRGSYAERGFEIVSYVDGTPYSGPKNKQEIERAAAGQVRASIREARQQARETAKPAGKGEAK